jgi:hypothetical protein
MSKYPLNTHNHKATLASWALNKSAKNTVPNLIDKLEKPHLEMIEANIQNVTPDDTHRSQVEDFIKDIFKRHHGAELHHFAPSLLAIFDQQNQVEAALGYRLAKDEALFLENYLDQSIESLVSHYLGRSIERHTLGETGNLASSNAASCKTLFAYTAEHLHGQGIEWFVSTGTGVMRVVYRRLGIKAHIIHDVKKSSLSEEQQATWGSFYEDKPKIILINVAQAKQRFKELAAKKDTNSPH